MNAPLDRKTQRIVSAVLEQLRRDAPSRAVPPRAAARKALAPEIRRLALDGLDDKAIAAMTGAKIGTVSTTIGRMRRAKGDKLDVRNGRTTGLLVVLSDGARAQLALLAAKRGVGVNSLAQDLLEAMLLRDAGGES